MVMSDDSSSFTTKITCYLNLQHITSNDLIMKFSDDLSSLKENITPYLNSQHNTSEPFVYFKKTNITVALSQFPWPQGAPHPTF